MKTSFLKSLLLLTILASFVSCKKEDSADVNQDKIYAEYELYYDKNADKTYASAVFKFSNALGTNLQLSAPSTIKFGTDDIPYDPAFAYYRKEYAGMVSSGTFHFADTDGTTYSNTVSLPATVTNAVIDTIHKASAYTYTWTGTPLAANQTIGLTIANTASPIYFKYWLQYTVGATTLVLPATDLNYIPNGPATVTLERTQETAAGSVTSAGGKIRGKYRALSNSTVVAN